MIGVLSLGDEDYDLNLTVMDPAPAMGSTYCLSGPGPLSPGQNYCPGVLDTAQTLSQAALGTGQTSPSVSIPVWGWAVGGVALLALVMSKKSR